MSYLIKRQLKELFSNKKNIVVIVSILFLFIIGTFYSVNHKAMKIAPEYTLGIIDEDNNKFSKMLVGYFENNDTFTSYLNVVKGNKEDILRKFNDGKILVYLEIPDHFIQNMMYLENTPIKVKINASNTKEIIVIQNILESYEKYIMAVENNVVTLYDKLEEEGINEETNEKVNYEISFDLIMTALGRGNFFDFHQVKDMKSIDILLYYIIAAIEIIISYLAVFVGISLIKERDSGILSRYLAAGNRMLPFILSKFLVSLGGLTTIFIVCFWVIGGSGYHTITYLLIYVIIAIFLLFHVGLYTLLSYLLRAKQNYILISNVSVICLAIIGGGIIPMKYMPDNLVTLSQFTPTFWLIKGITLLVNNSDIFKVTYIILFFLFLGVITIIVSSFLYQKAGDRYE